MSKLSEYLDGLLAQEQNPHAELIFSMGHYENVIAWCRSKQYNYCIVGPTTRLWNLLLPENPVMHLAVDEDGKPYVCGQYPTVQKFLEIKGTETGLPVLPGSMNY